VRILKDLPAHFSQLRILNELRMRRGPGITASPLRLKNCKAFGGPFDWLKAGQARQALQFMLTGILENFKTKLDRDGKQRSRARLLIFRAPR